MYNRLFPLALYALTVMFCARPVATVSESTAVSDYLVSIRAWQEELNAHYSDEESSPLPDTDRRLFTGHPFYEIDKAYRVEARLRYPNELQVIEMPTSAGRTKQFSIWAIASFDLHGQPQQLQVLKPFGRLSGPSDYLFIPFQDDTSGGETYGGGRYIDLPLPEGQPKTLTIDFNRAYHPYCAYTDGYNCPIPPPENRLQIPVRAGIRL